MSHPFAPQAIRDLYTQLMHAHLMHNRNPELAINWLETAYIVNAQNPSARETDLEDIFQAMMRVAGNLRTSAKKAFEGVLVHAILHDKVNEGLYLDTAWNYVIQPQQERRHEFLNGAAKSIKYDRKKHRLNEKKRPVPQRLAMAMLLSQSEGEAIRETSELVGFIMENPQHKDIIPTLNNLRRLNGKLFANLSQRYSQAHLNDFPSKTQRFEAESPEKKALLNAIFPDPNSLMAFAAFGLTHHLGQLRAFAVKDEHRNEETKSALQPMLNLLTFAMSPEALPILKYELMGKFSSMCQADWMYDDVERVLPEIHQELNTILQHLDSLQVPWREYLTEAFREAMDEFNPAKQGYFETAGFVIKHTERAPLRRLLACIVLSEMSHDDLVNTFKDDSKVLAALYQVTEDTRLIEHLSSQDKRAAITNDLGI